VKTSKLPWVARVTKPENSNNSHFHEIDAPYSQDFGARSQFHDGLPLVKPPYGMLNAVDLNKAVVLWQVPFGDTPSVRNHPALKGVTLPAKLGVAGAQGPLVTKGGLVFIGGGDMAFHAIDKASGQDLWSFALGQRTTSTPSTYRTKSGRQFVVIASGSGSDATLSAFSFQP